MILCAGAALGCRTMPVSSVTPAPSTTSGSHPATAEHPVQTDDDTLLIVSKAIRTSHLTPLADECLAYRLRHDERSSASLVTVTENHAHPNCHGDPQTAPTLFTVRVSDGGGKLETDAGSPGEFHTLPR